MFESILGLKIKSSIFQETTNLNLFSGGNQLARSSLIFGRNGSGKSTLSRAVQQLKTNEGAAEVVELIDENNNTVTLTDELKNSIFVFNENFIDKNIKLVGEGLDTIVILGKQKGLDEQITKLKMFLKEKKEEIIPLKTADEKFIDVKDISSPNYWLNQINENLKGIGNWAEREREIKNNRSASPVQKNTYKNFLQKPSKEKEELETEFQNKLKEFQKLSEKAEYIDTPVSQISLDYNIQKLMDLLNRKLEKPELNKREEFLFGILSEVDKGESYLKNIEDYFNNEKNDCCPYCTQPLDSTLKEELISSIQKLLSKIVEEHKQFLQTSILKEITFHFDIYETLDKTLINSVKEELRLVNLKIGKINQIIQEKINNPYYPKNIEAEQLAVDLSCLNEQLVQLEGIRREHNERIENIKSLESELITLNNYIAYYDINESYIKYQIQEKEFTSNQSKLKEVQDMIDKLEDDIRDLETKKNNIRIAVDEINRGLSYIFFNTNRLSIQYKNGKYYLISRGNSVDPSKISVGERNALAICYYFTDLLKDKVPEQAVLGKYLLVIDDPISSFDADNRVGIISYLKYRLNAFISGNKNTKVVLLTHDRQTYYDLHKMMQEIMDYCKNKENNKSIFSNKELLNAQLQEYNVRSTHNYSELLRNIYEFAISVEDNENFSGNSMRRAVEAFATFTYKTGIDTLTTKPEILEKLPNPYNIYFENLMYRLVLHNESHSEDNVKALKIDFLDYTSYEEKKKTAQDILVLLYLLNDLHVLSHFDQNKKDKVRQDIEAWRNTIKL